MHDKRNTFCRPLKQVLYIFTNTCTESESLDLLREFKLFGEVLDLLESNLMVVSTQV